MTYFYFGIFAVTPILGAFRNYSKYKTLDYVLFMRSPLVCSMIYIFYSYIFGSNLQILFASAITERWILLGYKGFKSYINNDYMAKKDKYIQKHGFKYD